MTPIERDERILSLKPQVLIIARARRRGIPISVTFDEIVSAAWLGAIRAVDCFDPAAGDSLSAFAEWKIRFAIMDYLRSVDPLGREHRRRLKRAAEDAPVTFSLTPKRDDAMPFQVADPRALRAIEISEAERDLARILARAEPHLSMRWKRILLRYYSGETMAVIAISERVNESRVSQICSCALKKLRAAA